MLSQVILTEDRRHRIEVRYLVTPTRDGRPVSAEFGPVTELEIVRQVTTTPKASDGRCMYRSAETVDDWRVALPVEEAHLLLGEVVSVLAEFASER